MTRIVLVGHVCIDRNTSEGVTYSGWGSSVLYMADYVQRHYGAIPKIITRYGEDLTGLVRDFSLLPDHAQHKLTLQYENITKGLERRQFARNTKHALPPTLDRAARRELARAEVVILAPLLPNYDPKFVREVVSLVPDNCLKVLTPQGYWRSVDIAGAVHGREFSEASQIVPLFDVAVFSRHDCPLPFEVAAEWVGMGLRCVVVTQGDGGASVVNADGTAQIATVAVPAEEIIDSVGCGDVFAIEFACALQRGSTPAESAQQANAAARRKLFAAPQPGQVRVRMEPAHDIVV